MKLDTKDYEVKMTKSLSSYKENLSTIRAGRATPDVLKKLKIKNDIGIGVINSIKDVPITEILHWKDPDYMNMVGDLTVRIIGI